MSHTPTALHITRSGQRRGNDVRMLKSGLNGLHMALIFKQIIALEPWRPGGPEIEASRAVRGLRNIEQVKKE